MKDWRNLIFPLILCGIVTINLYAQNDLEYYLKSAYQNSAGLHENRGIAKSAEYDKSIVEAQFSSPYLSVTSNYLFAPFFNNDKFITTSPGENAIGYDAGITNGGLYSAQLNLEMNLFSGGSADAFKNQADLKIKSAGSASEIVKHTLERDVTAQYLTAVESFEILKLSREIADTLRYQYKLAGKLNKNGLLKESDLLLLKLETDSYDFNCNLQYIEYRKNLIALNTICGITDTSFKVLKEVELETKNPVNQSSFLRQFEIDSLSLVNMQEINETKYLPRISLFINTGLNAVELPVIEKKFGMSAGVNFSLPLYDGGQRDITRQQTQISLGTVQAYRKSTGTMISNNISTSLIQIETANKKLDQFSEQISGYERFLALAKAELFKGLRSMTEYLSAVGNFIELKKNHLSTKFDILQSMNLYNFWNW